MPAQLKLTGKRETRLLALIEAGATLTETARAVGVSRMTVSRHRRADPAFAVLLRDAREQCTSAFDSIDWYQIAAQLEREHPERWALPDLGLEE